MPPRAVILDFDGVVVESLPAHLAAWCAAVIEVFKQPLPHPEELSGHATRTIAHILAVKYGDRALAGHLARTKERFLAEKKADVPVLGGAREFIEALNSRAMPYGIASNSTKLFVEQTLTNLGLKVDFVVTPADVARPKPAPDMFWHCANLLGVPPKERPSVLVFEDSAHGLKAAKDAGMIPIGITSEQNAASLLKAGARAVCTHLGEALERGWLDEVPLWTTTSS